MDSILTSTKKFLGISEECVDFDVDIIMCINAVFNILLQLGVGPDSGFSITDKNTIWTDYITDMSKLQMLKTYMALKVRMMFDPPTQGSLIESYKRQIDEFEFRLNVQVDPGEENLA